MGLVLVAFIVLLALENLAIGIGYRSEFVGAWEMGSARLNLSPIALVITLPVAISVVALARLAAFGRAWGIAIVAATFGAALAIGVSGGRRMASLALRAPFVVVLAVVIGALGWMLGRELPRVRPGIVAAGGAIVAVLAWLADAFLLRRLYPSFHLALFFITLFGWAALALVVSRSKLRGPLSLVGIVVVAASIAWTPYAAERVRGHDNLRRVLLERAPVLGRPVVVAARLAPPPPLEDDATASSTLANLRRRGEGARALDWKGHDIVLITVDALRADHVSAYGYARKTTPNIDALAARGARFEHAYCPTPHTSYSVTSMMTGKYMKPLLALGQEEDASETWPVQLRRYGYRTAAFYPPAVFFIDEHRFRRLRDENLGFEYKKEEFAQPELRRAQIERYLSSAPGDKSLFLWVHLFEPHEPYEMHAEHPFSGDPRVDAYDSEIASADALVGDIVKLVGEKRPPGTVFVVSADHGEEHGDHGGRYHGTTVYEEQVRVPLIVVGPGITPRVVPSPVQTIDLLPTSLAALDVPIPPRLRGRDLGPALVGTEAPGEEGLAFAETDDYTLVARGSDRLVCARKIGSCTLFDVSVDPGETKPVADREARVTELKQLTAAIERETGKVEASALPEALRRGMQGDREAAEDVAPLLDDARVDIRRLAARCAFNLGAPEMKDQLARAEIGDEDDEVRRWSALALLRIGDPDPRAVRVRADKIIETSLKAGPADERTAAALALVEQGFAKGETELVARWAAAFVPNAQSPGELDEARELLAAFAKLRSRSAVPLLIRSLEDVRLRPHIVDALGDIGDMRAKEPLLRVFAEERYVHLRPLEARVLFKLGAREKLFPALARFAGTPEPMVEAAAVARDAKLLTPDRGGLTFAPAAPTAAGKVKWPKAGPARLLVLTADSAGELTGAINGIPVAGATAPTRDLYILEVGELPAGDASVSLTSAGGIQAFWLVPRAPEIPPPQPRLWDAGGGDEGDEIPP